MTWQTQPGQLFDVEASRNGVQQLAGVITADQSGKLVLPLKIDAQNPVQVRVACRDR